MTGEPGTGKRVHGMYRKITDAGFPENPLFSEHRKNSDVILVMKKADTFVRLSTLKLYLLSILVGFVTGAVGVPYRYLLIRSVDVRDTIFATPSPLIFHFTIIAGMWGIGLFIQRLVEKFPMISGSGIPQTVGAIIGRFDFTHSFKSMVAKFSGGILGIGMGLSLGREGPLVQIGAFIAKLVSKWTRASIAHQKYLITSGTSAGLSSAYIAPLASSMFIIENVEKFDSSKIAISSLLGAITAGFIVRGFIDDDGFTLINTTSPEGITAFKYFLIYSFFGFILALVGKVFNILLVSFQKGYKEMQLPVELKILVVIIMTYTLGVNFSGLVAGGDILLLQETSTTGSSLLFLSVVIILKLIFTPICYATGFPGGIFLPLLVIGGLTGKWFAVVLSSFGVIGPGYFGFFMVIGMSALFAAVVRSPLTGLVLILEMTGKFSIFFPMMVVVSITFFISEIMGVRPVYDSLYNLLLPSNIRTSKKLYVIPFEVGARSYMEGKRIDSIRLPEHTRIVKVYRDRQLLPERDEVLRTGDRVEIELYSRDLEKLYSVFRSMSDE